MEKFVHWLQGYNEKEKYFLLTGFKFGSNIPYVGKREYRYSKNLKSANENPDILREFFFKEVKAGRVDGPFDVPPFSNLQISPLGLVPKKKIGEYRVIHHLSYPDQLSVIDGIPQDMCTVQYQTIDDAVSLLKFHGKGSLMSKTDLETSYRLVPINEKDHELLGFTVDGTFYYDKTLPMGLSYSCNLFEKFSTSIHWLVDHKLESAGCVPVLDDFLFVGPPNSDLCHKTLFQFLDMAQYIGIPIKDEKTVFPTTKILFLGLELDSIEMEIRLPDDKLCKLRDKLKYFQNKKKSTLQELVFDRASQLCICSSSTRKGLS